MNDVDARTQLAGQNRMELLLFTLGYNDQIFGINVFKVREVMPCPRLTEIPHAGSHVVGMTSIRGDTLPVIDVESAIGVAGNLRQQVQECLNGSADSKSPQTLLIVTEYNSKIQGFMVKSVDRIINKSWAEIAPPPDNLPIGHYLTATTQVDDNIVGILDVERVLAEMDPSMDRPLSTKVTEESRKWSSNENKEATVLIVDDSHVARKQLTRVLQDMGLKVESCNDGEEAFAHLESIIANGQPLSDTYQAIISDIEMPRVDGYTFVSNVKAHPEMAGIPVVLHSSLTGVFNKALAEKVKADGFIEKFDPDKLANFVMEVIGRELKKPAQKVSNPKSRD